MLEAGDRAPRRWIPGLTGVCLAFLSLACAGQAPAGYPSDYSDIVAAAEKEGKVVVAGTTDLAAVAPLIKDFETIYQGVRVRYSKSPALDVYNGVNSEHSSGRLSADVLWSSAMDLQIKLVNDGYAMTYPSPEAPNIPEWAVWRNQCYGTTFEPIVFVYNKRLLRSEDVPKSHADLTRLVTKRRQRFMGKVTSYDVERSGLGFLLYTQDAKVNTGFREMAKAIAATSPHYQASSSAMLERIGSGEYLIGLNLVGSYAMSRAKLDPNISYVFPSDYTLVVSRIMFISKTARNPNAAKLWVDYVLSRRGQTIIANQSGLGSIRPDVEGEATAAGLARTLGNALKPIKLGPGLLTNLDQVKRQEIISEWRQTFAVHR